jgi:hypothetical protein
VLSHPFRDDAAERMGHPSLLLRQAVGGLVPVFFFAELFPRVRVHIDDGFRKYPSNQGEPEAGFQSQEKQDYE